MLRPPIRSDRSEWVLYDKTDYPAYIRKGRLSSYPGYTAESHWHDDIELILILSGEMQYRVNGELIALSRGEGIFVNARQLHFGFSPTMTECEFICVLLHPILLCSSQIVEQKYVSPLLFNEQLPFCRLTNESDSERAVLSSIQRIYDLRDDELYELKLQREFFGIWIALCEKLLPIPEKSLRPNHNLSVLKDMISFIEKNHGERLTLTEIAAAGRVGKTGCCNIFKKYLNKTPNEYLTELRLRKAMELLRTTDLTILEISYAVGFSGASYFSETFRKFYSCTPSEYRSSN